MCPARFGARPEEARERSQRIDVFRPALLTLTRGEKVPAIIRNISETGARIEFFQYQALSDVVLLSEPTASMRVFAEVVWDKDGAGGLQFIRHPNDGSARKK